MLSFDTHELYVKASCLLRDFPAAQFFLFFDKFFRKFFPASVISSQQRFAHSHFTLTILSNARNETEDKVYWGIGCWRDGYSLPNPPRPLPHGSFCGSKSSPLVSLPSQFFSLLSRFESCSVGEAIRSFPERRKDEYSSGHYRQ